MTKTERLAKKYVQSLVATSKIVLELETLHPQLNDNTDKHNGWSLRMWLIQNPFLSKKETMDKIKELL